MATCTLPFPIVIECHLVAVKLYERCFSRLNHCPIETRVLLQIGCDKRMRMAQRTLHKQKTAKPHHGQEQRADQSKAKDPTEDNLSCGL